MCGKWQNISPPSKKKTPNLSNSKNKETFCSYYLAVKILATHQSGQKLRYKYRWLFVKAATFRIEELEFFVSWKFRGIINLNFEDFWSKFPWRKLLSFLPWTIPININNFQLQSLETKLRLEISSNRFFRRFRELHLCLRILKKFAVCPRPQNC